MNRPILFIGFIVVTLFIAIFAYEFSLGLSHYSSLKANDTVAHLSTLSRPGPGDSITLVIKAVPTIDAPQKLAIPARLGPVTLDFDCLHVGSIGGLFGVETCSKLSKVTYVNHQGERVQHPINGGTDLCYQFLELSGSVGSLVATPKRIQVLLVAGSEGWRRDAVFDGKSLYERDPQSI